MYTWKYLVKRVTVFFLTIFASISINFVVPRLIPGNPVQVKLAMLYQRGVSLGGEEFIKKFSSLFSLDQPMHIQFINYITNLFQGRMGLSISSFPLEVETLIVNALPWSIGLLSVSLAIGFIGGVLLGAFMEWKRKTGGGSLLASIMFSTFIFIGQIPFYLLGMILIFLLTVSLPIFPYGGGVDIGIFPGSIDYVISIVKHATLPALSIVLVQLGGWAISSRALMVGVLGEDYLFLAKAKGLQQGYIFRKYAFRNTLTPLLTDLAIGIGYLASGSLITEIIFSYPGIGWLLFNSVQGLDYPVIQGITLIIVLGVTTAALLIDLLTPLLDPRIGEK